MLRWVFAIALAFPLLAQEITTSQIASGILAPTDIQNAADGSNRLFLVQQNGLIRIFRNGAPVPTPFLDISTKTRLDGERGLLGLAFPPNFASKQRFYVDYTDLAGNTVIAMYRVSSNPDVADPTETVLLNINQPFPNHNGGQLRFGPDGYLYIGMGDGGSAGDPQGNGQRLDTLLGKLLRIDVESQPGRALVPAGNPFVGRSGARPEIWAYGLRNPWRFSFDRSTGDLWIADVGQAMYEEIDFQPAFSRGGENYGWNSMEGMHCFMENCSTAGLTLPIAEYKHDPSCSITGGFVYRGRASPSLRGVYLYGDYCSGTIWGLDRSGSRVLVQTNFLITTFGEDEAGELYVADARSSIYRIDARATTYAVNAASFDSGLVAGSLATIFTAGVIAASGIQSAQSIPLPLTLGGVSVTVNGIAAPILAVANVNGVEQVNFQTPWEVTGTTANVVVTRGSQSASATSTIASIQPGIFTSDGLRAVAVHNLDNTLVTAERPLERGEYAFLYATAAGPVSNRPATGTAGPLSPLATPTSRVEAFLGGVPCDVQFAGLAPGLVGVYQINFRVPPNAPSGLQPFRLRVADALSSQALIPVR